MNNYGLDFIVYAEFLELRSDSHEMDWRSVVICGEVLDFSVFIHERKPSFFYLLFVKLVNNSLVGVNLHLLHNLYFLLQNSFLFLLLFL